MSTSTNFGEMRCSIARTFGVIGDPWKALVLRDLHLGLSRFDQLVTDLGVSRKVLSQRLNTMLDDGLVDRVAYQDNPPRHDYVLTERGASLIPIVLAALAWGDKWLIDDDGPPAIAVHHDHDCTAVVVCESCGGPIVAADITSVVGPGGRPGPGTNLIGTRMGMRGHRDASNVV